MSAIMPAIAATSLGGLRARLFAGCALVTPLIVAAAA